MRLFEAAAANSVIICDEIEFAKREFGDNVLYVNTDRTAENVGDQIAKHFNWILENPERALEMASRCNKIFRQRHSLNGLFTKLPSFVADVKKSMAEDPASDEFVEIIIRVGSRPLAMVRRAMHSVAKQTHRRIGLIVVSFRKMDGLAELCQEFEPHFESIRIIDCPDNGLRSTALWAGLNAAKASYVGNVDDDDTIHPNHVATLLRAHRNGGDEAPMAYGGVIQVEEDDGFWFDQKNFRGDRGEVIKERRRLRFLEEYDEMRLWQDNYIQSNAWLIRKSALTEEDLIDPELEVAEDVYLYCLLARRGRFANSWSPTADWNWRSASRDNIMFSPALWGAGLPRLKARLSEVGVHMVSDPQPNASNLRVIANAKAAARSVLKFAREPEMARARLSYGLGVLRHGGFVELIRLVLRFGREKSQT